MKFLRSLLARWRAWCAWCAWRTKPERVVFDESLVLAFGPAIHREVTSTGVRVYSMCGSCGMRLECSATLCEECSQGPHTSAF